MSYIFKLVRKNGDFVKKSGSRRSVNLLFEHQFACQGPPPKNVVNFKAFSLGGYWDSDGLSHHSSDVKSCGESISERVTDVWALYLSTSGRFVQTSGFFNKISAGPGKRVPAWKCNSHVPTPILATQSRIALRFWNPCPRKTRYTVISVGVFRWNV